MDGAWGKSFLGSGSDFYKGQKPLSKEQVGVWRKWKKTGVTGAEKLGQII